MLNLTAKQEKILEVLIEREEPAFDLAEQRRERNDAKQASAERQIELEQKRQRRAVEQAEDAERERNRPPVFANATLNKMVLTGAAQVTPEAMELAENGEPIGTSMHEEKRQPLDPMTI